MALTSLGNMLTRLQRYQSEAAIDETYLVYDIDEAIREMKRQFRLPFLNKMTSLRVFPQVLLYPPASDHDYLVYMDTNQDQVPYANRMRARYTTLQQFYEDPDFRNLIAEIWDTNNLVLGVRDKNVPPGFQSGSQTLDMAESISNYTASLDASNLTLDEVLVIADSNASVQFTNTNTVTNQALVSWTFSPFTNSDYLKQYFFVYVYLTGIPTSVSLRFGVDSSNYLSSSVTSQFSGQAFKANTWNLLAFDLNSATTTGTINTSSQFAYAAVDLVGAATGLYNIGPSYLKGWTLLDYWYYSRFVVQSSGATTPDKESFIDANGTYNTSDSLIGVQEWADVITYKAMLRGLGDKENEALYAKVQGWHDQAMKALTDKYPDMSPLETWLSMRFQTDYSAGFFGGYGGGFYNGY